MSIIKMKKIVLVFLLGIMFASVHAESKSVSSPDGKLIITVSVENGQPAYSVSLNGKEFLKTSPLGLNTNIGDFTRQMDLTATSAIETIEDKYTLTNSKKSNVDYRANKCAFTFSQRGKKIYDVVFQVSNNDVAFKYNMYLQGKSLCCVIKNEATSFVLPDNSSIFACPQCLPMGGFARTSPSYETPYTVDEVIGKNGWGEGFTFPCLFRNNDAGWVLISETGVTGNYCGSRLIAHENGSYAVGFPQEKEFNGNGTASPGIILPGETPWRTITVGETLAPIVETTVPFDVVKPLYAASKEYTYGKGSWSWIIGMDESVNFDTQKQYIDFTAAMGWQSVLIDNWWDKRIGRDRMEQLAKYAASKGVSLLLWYNSNGYWNDAPQTPRNIMSNTIARRKEMRWLQSIGIKGIKVDFFGSDKQVTMQLYEDILADANDFGLEVIFHGCTLPRGWERMFPNFVACEAVLASENLHFSQNSCDAEALNACLHPFVRNAVGSMDFGGSTLNKFYNADNKSGTHRITSDVFALATAVLFQSSMQHFAMAPNNMTDAPSWAVDFMKDVPTTWDEIRFIGGYPGKYVVIARRSGNRWFVVGVNAEKEAKKLSLTLTMFNDAKVQMYSDDKNLNGSKKTVTLNKKKTINVVIPCNGGLVITNE